MRVLVTGASGAIGHHVCDTLLARGDEVVGLSRDTGKAAKTNPRVNWHEWQAPSERPPTQAFEGVDAVVNLIGEAINQRLTDRAVERIRASRVDASRNLLDGVAALEADKRPRIFVGQSAVGYYGERGEAIVDESTQAGDDVLAKICEEWEAAQERAAELGMRTVVLRTAPVLDPEAGLLKQLRIPFKLGVGGPLAGGGQYMPWIHIRDLVRILLWALDGEKVSGTINAASPNPVTNRVFSKALGEAMHRPAVVPTPKLAVTALLGRGMADAVTASLRVVPRRALDLGFEFKHPEVGPALHDLFD